MHNLQVQPSQPTVLLATTVRYFTANSTTRNTIYTREIRGKVLKLNVVGS